MHGEIVGDLLVERFVGADERGWIWECTCLGCGATLSRPGSQLRQAQLDHQISACVTCREQLRSSQSFERRQQRIARLRGYAQEHGTWWSVSAINYWMERIAADLEEEGFQLDADEPTTPTGFERWEPPAGHQPPQQRLAFIYPINLGEDRTIQCIGCNTYFEDGFGCVQCIQPVCRWCIEEEEHRCAPPPEARSLLEIGKELGVSMERARQLVGAALHKLRTTRARSGTLEAWEQWRLFAQEYRYES